MTPQDIVAALPLLVAATVTVMAALAVGVSRTSLGATLALAVAFAAGAAALAALNAPDAAAGLALLGLAAAVVLLAVGVLAPPRAEGAPARLRAAVVTIVTGGAAAVLVFAVLDAGVGGAGATPAARMRLEFGAENAVAAWLAGAEGGWTLAVLAATAAAGAVLLGLLGAGPRAAPAPPPLVSAAPGDPVLRIGAKRATAAVLVLGALAFAAPGSALGAGFGAGGLAAAAFLLYGLVFGVDAARRAVPVPALAALIGGGLVVAAVALCGAALLGGEALDMRSWRRWTPAGAAILAPLTAAAGVLTFSTLALAFLLVAGRPAALPQEGAAR